MISLNNITYPYPAIILKLTFHFFDNLHISGTHGQAQLSQSGPELGDRFAVLYTQLWTTTRKHTMNLKQGGTICPTILSGCDDLPGQPTI